MKIENIIQGKNYISNNNYNKGKIYMATNKLGDLQGLSCIQDSKRVNSYYNQDDINKLNLREVKYE